VPIDMAEQYIYEHLLAYGLDSVAFQDYPGRGTVDAGRNVVGQIDGTTKPNEIVIVGAHLDDQPWGELVAPGADDDASGCSANLYLARAFAGKQFERTIRFVFFGSEENAPWTGVGSTYGSGYYAAQARAAGENLVAMIEADALAYNGSNSGVVNMVTRTVRKDPGGGDHEIVTTWQEAVATYAIGDITPTLRESGVRLSDHGAFWKNGYPAVLFIHAGGNPNWHTVNDTVSTFTWPFYVQVTKSLVAVAAHEAGIQ
jgi:Zn-dependent M28 family amino/carboxypeptidase